MEIQLETRSAYRSMLEEVVPLTFRRKNEWHVLVQHSLRERTWMRDAPANEISIRSSTSRRAFNRNVRSRMFDESLTISDITGSTPIVRSLYYAGKIKKENPPGWAISSLYTFDLWNQIVRKTFAVRRDRKCMGPSWLT